MSALSPALSLPRPRGLGWAAALAEHATGLAALDRLYRKRPAALSPPEFIKHSLASLRIDYTVVSGSAETIPQQGALIVVSNHPFGAADGLILADLLLRRRPDTLLLANTLLCRVPEIAPLIAPVDVFRAGASLGGVRAALRHLAAGGVLIVFPAGEVSRADLHARSITDPPWASSVALLARRSGAAVLPVHIEGHATWSSLIAGLLHPRLRTLRLARDLLQQGRSTVRMHLGEAIPAKELMRLEPEAQTAYLRLLSDALGVRSRPVPRAELAPLAPPEDPALMAAEIAALPASRCLIAQDGFAVYRAGAAEIPGVLREIGRLRELSFRAAQEGSGLAADLDCYDAHYEHLWVWHAERSEVVGAYRLGFTAPLTQNNGARALYTHTLFAYDRRLLAHIGPSLELGRSFVRPEWQRSFRALRLLWSGIAAVLDAHPELRYLFGPVSISASYSPTVRALMETALSTHHGDPALQALVRPRTPARKIDHTRLTPTIAAALAEPAMLSRVVARLDQGQGLPVLLRHYLELRGRFAGFNVDDDFGGTLDGLVFIAVDDIPSRVRNKFGGSSVAHH